MSTLYEGEHLNRILSDRHLPSNDWCRDHPAEFESITKIAEAEFNLIKAIEDNDKRQWSKERSFLADGKAAVNKARSKLASVYLEVGLAHDVEQAETMSKHAQTTINHNFHHESLTTHTRR